MPSKYRPLIIALFLSLNVFSQRYEFDTFVEYEFLKDKDAEPEKTFEFTYSKDNSYLLSIINKDKKNFMLTFLSADGKEAVMTMSKKDFFDSENIVINCSSTRKVNLAEREKNTKEYSYIQLNDTIISKDTLRHFIVTKLPESKSEFQRHYIIQNGTEFHLPNITPGTTPYFKWKKVPIIGKGLFKETFIMKEDEIIEKMMLLQYTKKKKVIILERGCQY